MTANYLAQLLLRRRRLLQSTYFLEICKTRRIFLRAMMTRKDINWRQAYSLSQLLSKKNNRPFSTYFDILLTPLQLHQVVSNRTKSFKFNITETLIKLLLLSTKRRGIIITKLEASLGFVT